MNVNASIVFYPVDRESMDRICEMGMKTSPEFFSLYENFFDLPRRSKKPLRAASIHFFPENEAGAFAKFQEILVKSRKLFQQINSEGIRFTLDIGFLDFHEMDKWLQEKGKFSIHIPADFWGILAQFQCRFSFTFFCTPPEQEAIIPDADEEIQIILQEQWFLGSLAGKRRLTHGYLHIYNLNEAAFPIISPDWKRSDGEYRLPFPERLDWFEVGDIMYQTLKKWEKLFEEMKDSGAKLELSLSISREEQARFLRTIFGMETDWIRSLHHLEIPFNFTITKEI